MGLAIAEDPVSSLQEAMARIFDEHHAQVLRAAWRVTGNATDAEDVLQTVFLRLLRRDESQPPPENIAAYLHRAAVNAALDIVRARKEHAPLPAGMAREPSADQGADDLHEVLRQAVASLASPAAEILALRFFEGRSNREIARMLGISAVRVAVVVHRGRGKLEQAIRKYHGVKL